MMTEEEKRAIKDCDSIFICLDDAMSEDSANDYRKSYKILKNLIEKQSKEIEELSDKLTEKICKGVEEEILEEYRQTIISKDKEIEELKKENLEIRDWKYVIDSPIDLDKLKELDLIKIKGKEYVSTDKLKAKIEEIDIEIQCCEYADDDTEEYKQDIEKEKRRLLRDKAVLQSLF